jgi:outer membrane lipoprotein-sorting protein
MFAATVRILAMKKQISAVLIAALLSPLACFAQTQGVEPTRAQVQSELAKLDSVGYRPVSEDFNYPQSIQDAEAKVAALDQQKASYSSVPSATQNPEQSASSAQ